MEKFEKNKKISKNGQKSARIGVDNERKISYNKYTTIKNCFFVEESRFSKEFVWS